MALNAGSHNAAGTKTGPTSGPPPSASAETKAAIAQANNADPLGQHSGGQDGGDENAEKKVKSEKELERERRKADKNKKFEEKKAKASANTAQSAPRAKEKKVKPESTTTVLPEYVEKTPVGHKKILGSLDDEHHKAYSPIAVESGWYEWWEKEGFFKPQARKASKTDHAPYFSIPIPPPNVTGALHMGHAIATTLQDIMIRHSRQRGIPSLYIPGCDHAGIATQTVVENMLWRRERKTRHQFERPAFVALVQSWKDEYHKKICNSLRKLGASVDWSRERFTMDPDYQEAVIEAFVRLHDEGLIYRANRLVNWCPKLNTALSNLEVVNKELEGKTMLDVPGFDKQVQFGVLTHFKYPIENSSETIEVATTRTETMLGDTGIAVHPHDKRYKHLLGKKAQHPFVSRLLPIVADDYVEMGFGTGAVKITPAHDFNDFALGSRHNLDVINILTDDGMMNENTGSFAGMHRFEAREAVTTKLQERGLYVKEVNNPMTVPMCERSKDVIEPLIKPQWWMAMKELGASALKVVETGELKIKPETAEKSYSRWMTNLQDWCLSRQLWWGHQIPAWRVEIEGEEAEDRWVVARNEESAQVKARKQYPGKVLRLQRDEDVLDTWFSSGLWPFATLGWPNETEDLAKFYPSSVLETGWDILPFWVARMVFLGLKLTGKSPFSEVFCHSLIRDSEGRKMSKSLGNVIDPLDVMSGIELQALHDKLKLGNLDPKEVEKATRYQSQSFPQGVPECGADAVRFSLAALTTGGSDINLEIKIIHGYRKFCNKIYQATKFVLGKLGTDYLPSPTSAMSIDASLAERWILRKFTIASKEINEAIEKREFSDAASIAYQFWYTQLCDVFIENSKSLISNGTAEQQASTKQTLYTTISGALCMLHPFMPFLTEELWQRLPRRPGDKTPSILVAAYPEYEKSFDDPASEEAYDLVLSVSKAIRSLTASYSVRENGVLFVQLSDRKSRKTCEEELPSVRALSGKGVGEISLLSTSDAKPKGCIPLVVSATTTVFLLVKGHVDIDKEIEKLQKKLEKATATAEKQRKILNDEAYQKKVREEIQKTERKRLRDSEAEVKEMQETIQQFEVLKLEG